MQNQINKIPARLKNATLCITGGTGSFGNAVLEKFLSSGLKEIRIFSRDEKKQDDMRTKYKNPKIKCKFKPLCFKPSPIIYFKRTNQKYYYY